MSDEFDHNPENNYSSFWPLLILIVGLLGWFGYQVYATNSQRSLFDRQFQAEIPTINQAQNVSNKYKALVQDLLQTSSKDQYAAQIVKDMIKANMIQVRPNATNGVATPPAPK